MDETRYYCHLDSSGTDTNLQLYSLDRAYVEWTSLRHEYEKYKDGTENLKERQVFVVSCLGLSLSQLLGQNARMIKEKLDQPEALLAAFLNESTYDKNMKKALNRKFKKFIGYYDACRHFGLDDAKKAWKKVDSLDYTLVESFVQTTLDIWNATIGHHRTDYIEANDIKELLPRGPDDGQDFIEVIPSPA
jgi:hypothetical protein